MFETTTRNPFSAYLDDEVLAQVLFDLADRRRRGEAVDLEAALIEYPQYAQAVRRLFPMVEALAGLDDSPGRAFAPGLPGALGTIGDYRLIGEVGRGGMGIVYEAEQISLKRRVALKVLPFAAALDPRALTRFKQESLAAAQLDHPHIVHVYGVGAERGVHYYAMQFIEGQSLAQVIAEMSKGVEQVEAWKGAKGQAAVARVRREPVGDVEGQNAYRGPQDDLDLGIGVSDLGFEQAPAGSRENPKSEIPNSKYFRLQGRLEVAGSDLAGSHQPAHAGRSPDVHSTLAQHAPGISTDREGNRRDFYRSVARLAIQAADALDYAHQQGILHRDVKPGNLLLDETGALWITDFGLARIEGDDNLTRTGDLMGTLRYMSPEQALGERGLVDQRTDVYALGATLYEVLCLEPVFPENDRARLLQKIAGENPRPLCPVDRMIPEELETIVLKCLEKDPADRYLTARALSEDLARYLSDQPLAAKRATPFERLTKWSRRHQTGVLATAVAAALSVMFLAASAVWVMYEREQTVIEHSAAERHKQAAETQKAMNRRHRYVAEFNLACAAWERPDLADVKRHLDACRPQDGEEDLRGFEWYWLSNAVDSTPAAWRRHTGQVYGVGFARDGRYLASWGQDGGRIWSWPAGKALKHLDAHRSDVNHIDFSPDEALLATASDDGTVRIWDTRDWSERKTLVHQGQVIAALFSPDGETLACAERHVGALSTDGKPIEVVRLWSVASWEETGLLKGPPGELHSLAWSPDGLQLATSDGGMRVWDRGTSTVIFAAEPGGRVTSVAFAHERPLLAAGSTERVVIYNLVTRSEVASLPRGAESVTFTWDDRGVLTANRDRFARLWRHSGKGEAMAEIAAFRDTSPLWSARFTPDAKAILTTNHDGEIKRWDLDPLVDRVHFRQLPDAEFERALEFSPDGKGLLYNNDSLRLVNPDTGSVLRSLTEPGDVYFAMTLSSDGKWLAAANRHLQIDLWDAASWQKRFLTKSDGEFIESLAFVPGSEPALVVSTSARSFIAGAAPDTSIGVPLESLGKANAVAFSPDGRWAAFLIRPAAGPGMQVWDRSSGQRVQGVDGVYSCTLFSVDSRQFAAAGHDGAIRLWQTETWSEPVLLAGHGSRVLTLALSPDGRTVASAAEDGSIKLWNAATGRELLTFEARLYQPDCLRFSPDGGALAIGGAGGLPYVGPQVIVWPSAAR